MARGRGRPLATPLPTSTPLPTPLPPRASLSPRARYEAASRLEATDPDAALAQYRELAQKGGGWGQNALFAAGRLDADRGDRDEARRLLHQYVSLYPAGANANDARELLNRMR
jgi:TolA-binding protein